MLEFAIGIVLLIVVWNIRGAWYAQTDIFKSKVDLATKDQAVDLQDDISELLARVNEKKANQDGKWFALKDIDEAMKSPK